MTADNPDADRDAVRWLLGWLSDAMSRTALLAKVARDFRAMEPALEDKPEAAALLGRVIGATFMLDQARAGTLGATDSPEARHWLSATDLPFVRGVLALQMDAEARVVAQHEETLDTARRAFEKRRDRFWLLIAHRDGPTCAHPFCAYEDVDLTIDHKTPLARGGSNDLENLHFLCMPHNSEKGTRTWGEYLQIIQHRPVRLVR